MKSSKHTHNNITSNYGHFSKDGREYIITHPETPMPWVNVISNGDYGLVISQAGSGYSWRTHASLNRITRWEQDLVRDQWGKYLYLRDMDSGNYWSTSYQPCKANFEIYQVRHGLGYSVIEAQYESISSQVTYLVPPDDACELWMFQLENRSDRPRKLQIFSYFEWLLGAAPDWHREFSRTFIDTRFNSDRNTLLATKDLWDLPGQAGPHFNRDWPHVAFHSSSLPVTGFDGDKVAFLGRHGQLSSPQALQLGHSSNTGGRWGDGIGSLCVEISLEPRETKEVIFTLGAADDEDQALALAEKYKDAEAAHSSLEQVKQFWLAISTDLHVETPDAAANLMTNHWLKYQAIACRLWGRTAYYQTGGAFGFRDQLQDSLIWLLLGQPEQTLAQIRLHAAHQYQEGIVQHWWHPLAESGLLSKYSDDLLWLPFATLHYIYETGDIAALDEEIPFLDDGSATLLEHCLLAFRVVLERRSERGLPLILEGDWNDGMNATGPDGQGESIWMAHFLHYALWKWAELPVLDDDTRANFRSEAVALSTATNTHGWDGAWYWRATTDDGTVLGSNKSQEGKIFLNAQTWAILSDIATGERAQQVITSIREKLYQSYGPLLFSPGYTQPDEKIGYLSRYAPGVRENGGIYVHAACWAVLAERKMNGAEAAYRLWRSFSPPVRGEDADAYSAEPYVMPGNVHGPQSATPGRGGWSWYTGSAAWYLRVFVEGVLGVEARLEGLRVQADLPADWDEFRLMRRFRGATYDIHIKRASEGEQASCMVDGLPWDGEFLPTAEPDSQQMVEIIFQR